MKKINYNLRIYNFVACVNRILETQELNKLHEIKKYALFSREEDQSSIFHKRFYEKLEQFLPLYEQFIKEVIKPHFNNVPIVYQSIPTFRCHLVENIAVGEWHADSKYGHFEEVNCLVPLTEIFGTNSVWIESEEGKKDFKPMVGNVGDMFIFNGSRLTHGNKINTSGKDRVSFDFRVSRLSHFKEREDLSSINTKKKFIIGDYYNVI